METINNFTYIWEYRVKDEFLEEFVKIYGPTGKWAGLFKKAGGYIKTDLHQDISEPTRFISVDFWNSKEDRDNFLHQFAEEYELLDKQCEMFTRDEKHLGDFNCDTDRFSM